MVRMLVILMLFTSPLMAQGISIGLHGCGAWSKLEVSSMGGSAESDDYEMFYGAGADVSIKPPLSPLGVEGGFTYLVRNEDNGDSEGTFKTHPLYVNGKFYLSPMFYVGGGLNYTFWSIEIDGMDWEDLSSKIGFQVGGGIELGAGGMKIYGNAFYMIQKGSYEPEGVDAVDLETKSIQVRAGIRFGG